MKLTNNVVQMIRRVFSFATCLFILGYLLATDITVHAQPRRGAKTDKNIENNEKQTYPDLIIKKYDKDRAWPGNVIFVDKNRKCIVEANLEGKVV